MNKTGNVWHAGQFVPVKVITSGNGTQSAYYLNGEIIIDFVDLGSDEYLTVDTPFGFQITDAYARALRGGEVTSKTLTVGNGSTACTSAMSISTSLLASRATTLDSDQQEFLRGDNDLRITSSTHVDGDARVVISIIPV